jgi:hypothetical protein
MVNILEDLILYDESGNQIPVYVEGDAPEDLPNEYFTISEDYTSDLVSADNNPQSIKYEFTIKYYTDNAETLYSRLIEALQLLRSKKYITTGVGYANGTYEDRWFSRQADVDKIDYL